MCRWEGSGAPESATECSAHDCASLLVCHCDAVLVCVVRGGSGGPFLYISQGSNPGATQHHYTTALQGRAHGRAGGSLSAHSSVMKAQLHCTARWGDLRLAGDRQKPGGNGSGSVSKLYASHTMFFTVSHSLTCESPVPPCLSAARPRARRWRRSQDERLLPSIRPARSSRGKSSPVPLASRLHDGSTEPLDIFIGHREQHLEDARRVASGRSREVEQNTRLGCIPMP